MVKRTVYVPTAEEFKETFKLNANYKIPIATLKQYTKYVVGSYLLWKELSDIANRKPFSIRYNNKVEKIVAYVSDETGTGWQEFVAPLGSRMRLECAYKDGKYYDGTEKSTPFWTYTKFDKDKCSVVSIVYKEFTNELNKIRSKYSSKYRIEMTWRNYLECRASGLMGPIWLDGCDFMNELEVRTGKGTCEFIGDYDIKHTITNRNNIWIGNQLPAVKKIIDSIK